MSIDHTLGLMLAIAMVVILSGCLSWLSYDLLCNAIDQRRYRKERRDRIERRYRHLSHRR